MAIKKGFFGTYMFVVPAGFIMALGLLYPLVMAFQLSFFDWSMGMPWETREFLGLQWFTRMLSDKAVWESFWVTLRFGFWVVSIEMVIGTLLALLLEKPIRGASIFRTLFILPLMISPVVVGLIWRYLFDARAGMINYYLGLIGIEPVLWLASPDMALTSLIISDIWQWTPFIFIIVLAGLQALPSEVIEASRMDGANWWQSTVLVKLPMIKTVLLIALLMRIIDVYKVVEVVFILTFGGPGRSTELLALHIFKTAFTAQQLGYASAISILLLAIVTLLSILVLAFANPMKEQKE
jgi:multiple sugar transport system permease protein